MNKPLLAAAFSLWALAAQATNPQAANTAALRDPACTVLGDFYWEIGDAKERLFFGAVGSQYNADKVVGIASASKWVWGAYVLQDPAQPTPAAAEALRMLSGYTHFKPLSCFFGHNTVQSCLAKRGNDERSDDDIGHFSYNGGHAQKLAVDLGLGALDNQGLAQEIRSKLGQELAFEYAAPTLAGGMKTSATAYALFLRKILRGELRISQFLGKDAVCTTHSLCASAHESPGVDGWNYSYHHWVETDGSFSSAGAEGFYPWISADKRYYGVLSRQTVKGKAGLASAACGAAIRKAFFN
jgi:hypothetical protein